MRELISGVERGEERRGEVRGEVEKMKGYLERREEGRGGGWIKEVCRCVLMFLSFCSGGQ